MASTASLYLSRAMVLVVLACGAAKADLVARTDFNPSSARTGLLTPPVTSVTGVAESILQVDASGLAQMEFDRAADQQVTMLLMGGVMPTIMPAKLDIFRDSGPIVLYGTALLLLSRLARSRSQGRS